MGDMPSIWDHDLWQEIYDIPEVKTRTACADLYRLILDMRDTEVFAKAVADKVNAQRQVNFSKRQKIVGTIFGVLVSVAEIYQLVPHK